MPLSAAASTAPSASENRATGLPNTPSRPTVRTPLPIRPDLVGGCSACTGEPPITRSGERGPVSGPFRLVRAPRVETMRSRRPGKLLEGRNLCSREEARFRGFVRRHRERAGQDVGAVAHHEDRKARPHPCREQPVETNREAGLLRGLAHRGLLGGLVGFDETPRKGPVPITWTVVETHQEDPAIALDDGVRADLHVHEVGESADGAGRAFAPVDARGNEARAITWTEGEFARPLVAQLFVNRSFR